MLPSKNLVVKKNAFKAPKLSLLPKTFAKTTTKFVLPLQQPKAQNDIPAVTASPEMEVKKKKLQTRLKKLLNDAPKRAASFARNAAPVVAMARQGVQGALHKGAKVVRHAMDNYKVVAGGQQQQQPMEQPATTEEQATTPTPSLDSASPTTPTTPSPTTSTDNEVEVDPFDNEQFLGNGKIAKTVEFVKVKEEENPDATPKENELIDTKEIALGYSEWRVENSCRSRCIWLLMLLNVILFISIICDVSVYKGVLKLLLPFGHILNTETNSTSVEQEEEDYNEKYQTMVVIASGLTFFCASLRFFLLLKVMEMEDADYQGKPSSFPCSCFNFFTLIMVGFWLFITISISDNLVDIVKNFEEIFKAKEAIYANFSSPQIMIQMDKLQQTFKCCGASGIESWYKQDLYKFLKINASKDHSDVERYWSRFKECHASGKNSELNEFMSFHSKSNNKEKTVNSVPYSCCSAEAENPCFFYNIDGKFGYWNVANPVSALHNASCMDKVKPKLYELGLKIESLYFYRLLLEVIMFLVSCVVQSSFESYHEHHHRPSVASLPLCWTLLASIVLTVFYNFSLHFFLWKYSFQVFFGSIDQGKLAELVGSLQGILNVVDTANSTNLSSS